MSTYKPPVPVPAEAVDAVRKIVAEDIGFWEDLKAFNRSEHKTGAMLDAMSARHDANDERIEALRRKWFPRTARLMVDRWGGVYTCSPTARIVRKVWVLPAERA